MRYIGSKNRLAKYLLPIIQPYVDAKGYYLEPFVGGGNFIDKIKCDNKFGSDNNKYLIALLKQTQIDTSVFPFEITEEEYQKVRQNKNDYEDWYVGLVGFCSSFGSKFFGGYARSSKSRNESNESIRNLIKQSENLKNIQFNCCDYNEINQNIKDFVIYCDPPYKSTIKYKKGCSVNYEEFYDWCVKMSKKNIVFISEYDMPLDKFECIWQKDITITIDSNREQGSIRTEKLFKVKNT